MPLMIVCVVAVPSLCNSSMKRYEPMLQTREMPKHCDEYGRAECSPDSLSLIVDARLLNGLQDRVGRDMLMGVCSVILETIEILVTLSAQIATVGLVLLYHVGDWLTTSLGCSKGKRVCGTVAMHFMILETVLVLVSLVATRDRTFVRLVDHDKVGAGVLDDLGRRHHLRCGVALMCRCLSRLLDLWDLGSSVIV